MNKFHILYSAKTSRQNTQIHYITGSLC